MLVISRKVGESFMVGDEIEIKILKIEGGEVKVGISAPLRVKIYRTEIYQKIVEANLLAAQSSIENIKEVIEVDQNKLRSDKTS